MWVCCTITILYDVCTYGIYTMYYSIHTIYGIFNLHEHVDQPRCWGNNRLSNSLCIHSPFSLAVKAMGSGVDVGRLPHMLFHRCMDALSCSFSVEKGFPVFIFAVKLLADGLTNCTKHNSIWSSEYLLSRHSLILGCTRTLVRQQVWM